MAQQRPANNNDISSDNPLLWMGILAVPLVGMMIAWHFWHEYIAAVYVYVRLVFVIPVWWGVNAILDAGWASGIEAIIPPFRGIYEWVGVNCAPEGVFCSVDFATVKYAAIADSSMWFNILIALFLFYRTFKVIAHIIKNHPHNRFSKVHNLESFCEQQEVLYPHLTVYRHLADDLIDADLHEGKWRMPYTSRSFISIHGLVRGWEDVEEGKFSPQLNVEQARAVFKAQLGPLFSGKINDIETAYLMVLAVTLPRVAACNGEIDDDEFKALMAMSNRMMEWNWKQFNVANYDPDDEYSWLHPTIDRQPLLDTVQHPSVINSPLVRRVFMQHAFVKTILMRTLADARGVGVLPPCEFRWLRFFDYDLWITVSSFGGQTFASEGAGAMSHYLYEFDSHQPLVEPYVDNAIEALKEQIDKYSYTSIEKSWIESGQVRPTHGSSFDTLFNDTAEFSESLNSANSAEAVSDTQAASAETKQ